MKEIIISDGEALFIPDEVLEELKRKYGKRKRENSEFEFSSEYYYVDDYGYAVLTNWWNDDVDESRLEMGNVFKTEDEAEAYAEWLKAVATIRRSSDWNDASKGKYYVNCRTNVSPLAYYSSQKAAEKALADPKVKHAYEVVFGVAK